VAQTRERALARRHPARGGVYPSEENVALLAMLKVCETYISIMFFDYLDIIYEVLIGSIGVELLLLLDIGFPIAAAKFCTVE
jgi:hypothetical protein